MWPDNETATDLLGFDVHANLLRAVITDDSMLPLTIGVFGDWGGGKTSIMKMLETSLDPNTYAEGSAQHSQCNSIATVYVKEHKRFGPKVRDRALTLLRSVNWLRFGRLTLKHIAAPAAAAFFTGGLQRYRRPSPSPLACRSSFQRRTSLEPRPATCPTWRALSRRTSQKKRRRIFEHSRLSSQRCSRTAGSTNRMSSERVSPGRPAWCRWPGLRRPPCT